MKAETPTLFRAASDGDVEAVRTLLADGTPVDVLSSGGQTALMFASIFGHGEVVAVLLLAGADPDLTDPRGLSAQEWATRRGFADVAKLIESHSGRKAPVSRRAQKAVPPETDSVIREPTLTNETTEPLPTKPAATGKMGGAAGAILRNRLARAEEENPVLDFSAAEEEAVVELRGAQSPAEFVSDEPAEHSSEIVASVESDRESHEEQTEPVTTKDTQDFDESRDLEFALKDDDKTVTATSVWDADLSRPDVVVPKPLPSNDTMHLREDADTVGANASRAPSQPVHDFKKDETLRSPAPRNSASSFLAYAQTPAASGRPVIWILIFVTLGASAYGAYRLNNYLSRPQSAPAAAATQTAAPQPTATASVAQPASEQVNNTQPPVSDDTAPVAGGPLAGTELDLPKPDYPAAARNKGVQEVITVTVRVNRAGRVISWRTGDGNASLRAAALKVAKRSTFSPEKLPGTGEVVGTITYNFKL